VEAAFPSLVISSFPLIRNASLIDRVGFLVIQRLMESQAVVERELLRHPEVVRLKNVL
jgi:hypothetical protein